MAWGGLFFPWAGRVHSRFGTPLAALLAQGVWSAVLALTGTYEQLITYVVFASWIFYAMSCGAVIRLRQRVPDAARPYRVWGYPATPVIFIAFAAWLVGMTIAETPVESLVGAGIVLAGVPAYWYWARKGEPAPSGAIGADQRRSRGDVPQSLLIYSFASS